MNKATMVLVGCSALLAVNQAQSATPQAELYAKAVRDAAVASPAEISAKLVRIDLTNNNLVWNNDKTKVKVVTWKSQSSYENNILPYTETSPNETYVIWVTAAPYIHDFCHNYVTAHPGVKKQKLDLRLKQRLGLHFSWSYDVFVELWVNPADLFRPCVDPNPADNTCDLNFGGTIPTVKNIQDYGAFYKNLYYSDFRTAPGVPWTGLGYTYDWNNPAKEKGESEFIIAPSSPYEVIQAVPTLEYCSN